MTTPLLALYGLKYHPFASDVPTDALYCSPTATQFFWRIEHYLIKTGGFALIHGEPGTGKSVAMRLLATQLEHVREIQLGVLTHPSARVADFYRELGDLFGVTLQLHNRWHGFKSLRERWLHHIDSTLLRPVLFIDEAQEMPSCVLNELRLLSSMHFDSRSLLTVIFAGDQRFTNTLRRDDLMPLGSRIRFRLQTEYASPEQLLQILQHLVIEAGNPRLMSPELMQTLCEHAMGNVRALCNMASECLATAARQEKKQLDEQVFLECFAVPATTRPRKGELHDKSHHNT